MGLFGTILSFGAGYVAGMRIGNKPVTAARGAMGEARRRASSVASRASEMRGAMGEAVSGATGGVGTSGTTIDVRNIREVMTTAPETVGVDGTLRDAAQMMERADIGSVIVTDGDAIAGIITDRDIALRGVAAGRDPSTTHVSEAMTRSVVTIDPSASVQEAIDLMRQHDVRRVPVAESGRAVGVVSLADLSMTPQARALLADISTAPPNN